MMKVRIKGINNVIRNLSKISDDIFDATRDGIRESAEYLKATIESKFGEYQKGWSPLQPDTIARKETGDSPLLETGEMRDSLSIQDGGKGRLSAIVVSDSDILIHHVYGAPNAGVPKRDPFRVTAVEEASTCTAIIKKHISAAIERNQ